MEEGKELVKDVSLGGPITHLQTQFKKLDTQFKTWLSKQSAPVEVALTTATSALQGGAIGALMGTLTGEISSSMPQQPPVANPQAMASLKQAQAFTGGPLVQARNFAVMTGVNAGITCAMKRLRGGVEDVQTSMVAAFGSGAMFTLVSGVGGPNMAQNAVTSGLFFALIQGGLFKVGQKFSQPPAEENYYLKTKTMLSKLGLQNYEKNFKKGLLTDSTLPLLTDRGLNADLAGVVRILSPPTLEKVVEKSYPVDENKTRIQESRDRNQGKLYRTFLDNFVIVFLDDILIYSFSIEEHQEHLRQVLQVLREHHLFGNLEKCSFFQSEIQYLGHIITGEGISVDPSNIYAIIDWPTPTTVTKVRRFMGLVGYYHHFVQDFYRIANPITSL
ncbi:hypothetical protein KI387_001135 [Taxus chinensis]|uniref:Reverse transcriptase domain-containing protein n=1 Tax=Taxus chinensis TaxID=29808 RepID=A0AA38GWT0_TAXCH|nr:hypothetical protein KI387_001135 [Taxus chinensis]